MELHLEVKSRFDIMAIILCSAITNKINLEKEHFSNFHEELNHIMFLKAAVGLYVAFLNGTKISGFVSCCFCMTCLIILFQMQKGQDVHYRAMEEAS